MLIKICGITNAIDAVAAADAGADLIGLIFVVNSTRCVTLEEARSIVSAVAGRCKTVGVFQDALPQEIASVKQQLGLDYVQLHGREQPADVEVMRPCIKAVAGPVNQSVVTSAAYSGACDLLLFDREKGSSDQSFPTALAAELVKHELQPYLVAGGITPENVGLLVRSLVAAKGFAGIDVASGVEESPRRKDHLKLQQLINTAREASGHVVAR